jgi:hypothetical protein
MKGVRAFALRNIRRSARGDPGRFVVISPRGCRPRPGRARAARRGRSPNARRIVRPAETAGGLASATAGSDRRLRRFIRRQEQALAPTLPAATRSPHATAGPARSLAAPMPGVRLRHAVETRRSIREPIFAICGLRVDPFDCEAHIARLKHARRFVSIAQSAAYLSRCLLSRLVTTSWSATRDHGRARCPEAACSQRRLMAGCSPTQGQPAATRNNDSYRRATLHSVAFGCIPWRGQCLQQYDNAPAPHGSRQFRILRDWASGPSLSMVSGMDQNLYLPPVSGSKFGRSLLCAAAAAPAAFDFAHPQVVGRKQMAIAANSGDVGALIHAIHRKAHHLGFGCSKARPRYQLRRFATLCAGLQRCRARLSGFRASPPGCHPAATLKRLSGVRFFEQHRSNAGPPRHEPGAPTRHSDHYIFALHRIRPAEAAWQFRWPKHEMQHPPSVVDQSLRRSVE